MERMQWWIAFGPANLDPNAAHPSLSWWSIRNAIRWLAKPGFQHCFAFTYHPDTDAWIVVEYNAKGLDVQFAPDLKLRFHGFDGMVPYWEALGFKCLPVVTERRVDVVLRVLPIYCVQVVKSLLGIRAPWALTPYQLFKHMERHHEWRRTRERCEEHARPAGAVLQGRAGTGGAGQVPDGGSGGPGEGREGRGDDGGQRVGSRAPGSALASLRSLFPDRP